MNVGLPKFIENKNDGTFINFRINYRCTYFFVCWMDNSSFYKKGFKIVEA